MYFSWKMLNKFYLFVFTLLASSTVLGQYGKVDHWETAIFASEEWRYHVGTTEPDTNWRERTFDHSAWSVGKGGLGFGYSNLKTVIPTSRSLFLRKTFTISDISKIEAAILLFDYDASFVAYINGYEFRRVNIGKAWDKTRHSEVADLERKAQLVDNGSYEEYILKDFQLNNRIINGDNVLAIQVHGNSTMPIRLAAFFNLLFGMEDDSTQFSPAPSWYSPPPMYAEYSTLPIVRITSPRLNDSLKIPGAMEITWHGKGEKHYFDEAPNHYNGPITIKNRGNSTLEFPKKSMRIETQDSSGENLNMRLLGLPSENDWVLYAPYTDKSLLRNYVMYDIARNMLEWAPRTQLCEVFHNGYYLGVYVFTEKIKRDRNRVNIRELRKKDTTGNFISGGYMTKVDWQYGANPAAFTLSHNTSYQYYSDITFEHVYPEVDSLHPKQKQYIEDFYFKFQENLLSDSYTDLNVGYRQFVSTASFADYMILNELSKDIDSYRYSTYFYKNHVIDDGLIHLGPAWDYNLGFGNVDFGTEGAQFPIKWMYNKEGSRIWWFARLLEDPNFAEILNCRWNYYRSSRGTISKNYQFSLIDDAIAEMGEAVTRNHYHWKTLGRYVWPNNFVGETYQEEIDFLKKWIEERIAWIDINVPGDCNTPVNVNEIKEFEEDGLLVFPNPATSQVQIVSEERMSNLELFDISGQSVFEMELNDEFQVFISADELNTGLYFLQITTETGNLKNSKLIKQ